MSRESSTTLLDYSHPAARDHRTKIDWLYILGWTAIGFVSILGMIGIVLKRLAD